MINLIIGLFSITALLGMYLLTFVLKGKATPKAIVFTHGPLAAIALILLIVYAYREGPEPLESIVLFTLAAMGGFVLVFRDLTGRSIPKWLAVGHGLLAVTGFVFLLIFAFR
jgi:hypothetical protein